jgi:Sec-independent protein translocase protein TatA
MLEMELIEPEIFEMELAGQIPSTIGGTTNYNELSGKPKINGVELKGNKTLEELGIDLGGTLQEAKDYADNIKPTKTSELTNDSNFAKTNQNNNFSTSQTVNGTLTINGDIVQNGASYETHAEQIYTQKDEIITRDGAVGGLNKGELTGIRAKKYDGENDGQLGFDANGEARVGDENDTQPLLTRDEIVNLKEGQVLVWDGTNLKAIGSDDYVKNTDVASQNNFGLIKAWMSTNEDGEIGLNISTEV